MDFLDFFMREQNVATSLKIDITADFPEYQCSWHINASWLVDYLKMEKGCQDLSKQ